MGQRCEFKDLDGTYVCKFCPLIPSYLDANSPISSASSERLKQAAAASLSSVVSAGSNVMVGALVIILATALAALVTRHIHPMAEGSRFFWGGFTSPYR